MIPLPGTGGVDFHRWLPEAEAIYTDAVVAELAGKHKIGSELGLTEFARWLRIVGAIYLDRKSEALDLQRWERRQKIFAEVQKHAARSVQAIDKLDDAGRELLLEPEQFLSLTHFLTPGETGPFGHTVRRREVCGGAETLDYARQDEVLEAPKILREYARHALAFSPKGFRGRPSDSPLRVWTVNIHRFWTRRLNRRFTYSAERGLSFSPAFRFCVDAIAPLDASVTSSNLATAMRAAIQSRPASARLSRGAQTSKKSP